jgi:hypothetical protein
MDMIDMNYDKVYRYRQDSYELWQIKDTDRIHVVYVRV